jgi:hypothetical protein
MFWTNYVSNKLENWHTQYALIDSGLRPGRRLQNILFCSTSWQGTGIQSALSLTGCSLRSRDGRRVQYHCHLVTRIENEIRRYLVLYPRDAMLRKLVSCIITLEAHSIAVKVITVTNWWWIVNLCARYTWLWSTIYLSENLTKHFIK